MADSLRIAAADKGYEERVQSLAESVQARLRYHSIPLPDGSVLPGLQSVEHLQWRLGLFGLEQDLRGKRVLDVGAWDGWFSFECERRGAEVVAVDCVELETFLEARRLLGSRVDYRTLDVSELSAKRLGRFDIVLFFGVLYHLRHPLLGLERAMELSKDRVLVESFVIPSEVRDVPAVMEFYERGELGGQIDNWCGPSPECLLGMARAAGFARAEIRDITNQRASAVCYRHWPDPLANATPAPHLNSAINNRTYMARFHPDKDEYICCFFQSAETSLTPDTVMIEVDGYGVPALSVHSGGQGAWQVDCVRPMGLDSGRHEVRLRTTGSARSNPAEFLLLGDNDPEPSTPSPNLPHEAPELCSAEFHPSRDQRLAINRAGSLICYFRSPAESMGIPDVSIEAGSQLFRPSALSSLGGGVWQINILLREPLEVGALVRIRLGGAPWSNTLPVISRA
jgi:tRNA (mo5U34)-methyltransferase